MRVEIDDTARFVRVHSNNKVVVELLDFPVSALKEQLRAWLTIADDGAAPRFIFRSDNPEWTAAFRIEPRPSSWQFTSWKERFRSPELLSLEEWRNVLRQSGV